MSDYAGVNDTSISADGVDVHIKKRVVKVVKVIKKTVIKKAVAAMEPVTMPVTSSDTALVSSPPIRDESPNGYIATMDDMSKKAMAIAREHLESSFNLEKSNGYLDYINAK